MVALIHQLDGAVGGVVDAIAVELALGGEASVKIIGDLGGVPDNDIGRTSAVDGQADAINGKLTVGVKVCDLASSVYAGVGATGAVKDYRMADDVLDDRLEDSLDGGQLR